MKVWMKQNDPQFSELQLRLVKNKTATPHSSRAFSLCILSVHACMLHALHAANRCPSITSTQYRHTACQSSLHLFALDKGHHSCLLKEELHNRINLSLEERVKNFKHNSENLMKIGWKIRKLWHFEVSQIFTKHFLTSRYEYANEWVDDVITSLLAIYFVHKILKIVIFCPNMFWKFHTVTNVLATRTQTFEIIAFES